MEKLRNGARVIGLGVLAALMASCSTISRNNVDDWPFKDGYDKAQIICRDGKPGIAVINGKKYALNGMVASREKLPTLTHDTGIFASHPNPEFAAIGMKAWLNSFREAAEKKC